MLFLRQVPYLIGAALLVACQTGAPPALSLEEAKQITATFEGAFTPPPKTINDITAILDEQQLADPEETNALIALAQSDPPKNASLIVLADFYNRRTTAADTLGLVTQAIEDSRTAVKFLERMADWKGGRLPSGDRLRSGRIHRWRANLEMKFGNFRNAIEGLERAMHGGTRYVTNLPEPLVKAYTISGDLDGARRTKRIADAQIAKILASGRGRGMTVPQRRISSRMISALMEVHLFNAEGRWREAERSLRVVIEQQRLYPSVDANRHPLEIFHSLKDLARNLMRQGRLMEAEITAREGLLGVLGISGKYTIAAAEYVQGLAQVLEAQGRHEDSASLLRAAIEIYQKLGIPPESVSLGKARFLLGEAMAAQGDWSAALELFERVRTDLKENQIWYDKWVSTGVAVPLALVKSRRAAEAVQLLTALYANDLRRLGPKHMRTAEKGGVLAMALAIMGEQQRALAAFGDALPILLSRSRQSDDETTTQPARARRLGLILESYVGLLTDIRGTATARDAGIDAAAEAFRIANVAPGRSVQRALAASGARAAARDPALADLVRREQDAQKQVSALYGLLANLLSAPTDQRDPRAVQDLRTRIDTLRGARAALMEEIEARFPDYADLINPKPATIEQARAALRPGEALIATYVVEDRTYVWAIPNRGPVAFAAADIGRENLADTVALLRSALEPNAQTLGDIPDFDVAAAYGLYERLLKPVEAGWKRAKSLLVVADGALGYLPLPLLPTAPVELGPESGALFSNYRDVPWLARTHSVTMLPSVASLATLRGLPPGAPDRKAFAGFGDPLFSAEQAAQPVKVAALTNRGLRTRGLPVRLRAAPKTAAMDSAGLAQLPRLPDTADEVRSIAVALNADLTEDVFLGERANEGRIKSMDLSGYKVLAFATHGLVPGDLDGLTQPALAFSAPDVANDPDNDGLLTMGEILGLKLDADWVVLSACNTASGEGAGAEAVSGLGRAFFYAGTRALLVSNWPVETTSAKALTTDLFKRQAANDNLTRAEALRQSMNALIDGPGYVDPESGKTVFSYAHPIFWAPFSLIGDGGGSRPAS